VIRRALLSVYDKTGLEAFARGLAGLGVELVSSGGTARALADAGLGVTSVEEVTGVPELLGHRVVTLHPRIHGGILADRGDASHRRDLERHGIEPFDLVVCNLYPFAERPEVEMIDIGGPAMVRAAAKNHAWVGVVTSPAQYEPVLAELWETGSIHEATRGRLALEAFAHTAAYDAAIVRWLQEDELLPRHIVLALERELDLAYGENPHQRAAYYIEAGAAAHLLSGVERLGGRDLSFNNLNDLAAARRLCDELDPPACVIVKHANPCGAAVAATIEEAYASALACDPVSAYGGVVVVSGSVEVELARKLAEQFVEVLLAPAFSSEALEVLREKPALRILSGGVPDEGARDFKRVAGAFLVQGADRAEGARGEMDVVTRAHPDERSWADLLLAWTAVKHVASKGIVIVKDRRTIGIGAGQMSRVDAVAIALEKAREHGHDLRGAALASDAFFPFADGPQLALDAGVTAIVQPGGSKRDAEVITAAEAAGAAMVFTHRRHFRH
jgi:phosphoribosylaminoimidazolecarboxamide formyltransferase/IMP cyclohydrolase